MFVVADFKASVQFDLNDPELAQKLLELSSKLVIRGDATRVSYGSAGKALVIALLKRPDLVAELIGEEPPDNVVSIKKGGRRG